ncbi:thiamine diphosphokinase [Paracoccus suum]|uniref:thiamine diphosphokinase n=1 Tax=Paracoccus suum TaxID=2259340 RepID=UPI0026B066AB
MIPVLRTAGGVTLVGGGELGHGDLAEALSTAPLLVAADSGADAALAAGHVPDAVIGDFDSISPEAQARIPRERLHRVAEQDSTDFAKCLSRIDAGFVLALGFEGRRLDHTLAALTVMTQNRGRAILMLGAEDVTFLAPPRLDLPLAADTRVSLWPMGPARGISTGLRWPIDGIEFAPHGTVGTSNIALGPVSLAIEGPMLVLLPREQWRLVLAALT